MNFDKTSICFSIPKDFLIQTLSGAIEYQFGKRTLLTARTREGKTLLTLFLLASEKIRDPNTVCIMFGPNMVNFVEDIRSKIEFFEEFQSLGIHAVDFRNREAFMAELAGVSSQPTVLAVNSDASYVKRIIPYLKGINRKIIAVIDEAHKGGEQSYVPLLNDLRQPNISIIETTATFRNRLLTATPADFIASLYSTHGYTTPNSAKVQHFSHNEFTQRNQCLHQEQIDFVLHQNNQPQSLVLINGYDKNAFHDRAVQQLKTAINSDKTAIVTIHKGGAFWTTADTDNTRHQLYHNNTAIRAASSAVSAVYGLGFRHIVVIGQKQVAEGQTVGCSKLSLTGQIVGTPIGRQKAETLTQTIRTGGLNILGQQTVLIDRQRWDDYCRYNRNNEDLSHLYAGKSPEEQQLIAEQAYFDLKTLKVSHGDYSPTRAIIDAEDVGSYFFTIPIHSFGAAFEPSYKESTSELYNYVRSAVRNQPWYSNQSLAARRVIGDPNTSLKNRGNDVSLFINADPTSSEVRTRPLVFWKLNDSIAIRYVHSFKPSRIHNYYGTLQNFTKSKSIILKASH